MLEKINGVAFEEGLIQTPLFWEWLGGAGEVGVSEEPAKVVVAAGEPARGGSWRGGGGGGRVVSSTTSSQPLSSCCSGNVIAHVVVSETVILCLTELSILIYIYFVVVAAAEEVEVWLWLRLWWLGLDSFKSANGNFLTHHHLRWVIMVHCYCQNYFVYPNTHTGLPKPTGCKTERTT